MDDKIKVLNLTQIWGVLIKIKNDKPVSKEILEDACNKIDAIIHDIIYQEISK